MQTNVSVSYKEIWSLLPRLSWHLAFARWTFTKSGIFVNKMCLPELQVPPGSALFLCSVHPLIETSLAFLIVSPILEKLLPLIHITVSTEPLQPEMSQISQGQPSLFLHSEIATPRIHKAKEKQWKVHISEASRDQWVLNSLMRHVFHHSLWKALSSFSWGLKKLQRRKWLVWGYVEQPPTFAFFFPTGLTSVDLLILGCKMLLGNSSISNIKTVTEFLKLFCFVLFVCFALSA